MALVKLNGQSNIERTTCFSYAPTILELTSASGGDKATYQMMFDSFDDIEFGTEYQIKVNNTILTSTSQPSDAKGYRFYYGKAQYPTTAKAMINSIVEALRRIPELASGYSVYMPDNGEGGKMQSIVIQGLRVGINTPITITHNVPNMSVSGYEGYSNTEFKNGSVKVDVYKAKNTMKYGYDTGSYQYLTTMSKKINNDVKVAFDLGGIFSSMTGEGENAQFKLEVYKITDNALTEIGTYKNIYNVNGYLINQGGEFIPRFSGAKVALNARRGENRNYLNNTILYVYENTIPISFFVENGVNAIPYTIRYVGSDNLPIMEKSETISVGDALTHATITLSDNFKSQSKYIDIVFTDYDLGTLRFNVVKPVKLTDEAQRIYWYNSWGGISFMDFCGDRTEERKVKNTTYQESVLNYYDDKVNEKDFIYDKQNEITVKLTTHNIQKDAQWHLFDLQQSRTAWTYIQGIKYRILVSDLTINTTSVSDIYTATIEYTYSMGTNI